MLNTVTLLLRSFQSMARIVFPHRLQNLRRWWSVVPETVEVIRLEIVPEIEVELITVVITTTSLSPTCLGGYAARIFH